MGSRKMGREGQDNCGQGIGRGYRPTGTYITTTFSSNDPKTCCIAVWTIPRFPGLHHRAEPEIVLKY